jgi:hypothetical protein
MSWEGWVQVESLTVICEWDIFMLDESGGYLYNEMAF